MLGRWPKILLTINKRLQKKDLKPATAVNLKGNNPFFIVEHVDARYKRRSIHKWLVVAPKANGYDNFS